MGVTDGGLVYMLLGWWGEWEQVGRWVWDYQVMGNGGNAEVIAGQVGAAGSEITGEKADKAIMK